MSDIKSLSPNRPQWVGVDVDGVLVDSYPAWQKWAKETYDIDITPDAEDFDMRLKEYWKIPDIYDNQTPIPGVPEKIKELRKYYTIVFISRSYNEHLTSKLNFLKKYYEFDGFVSAKEKHKVNFDYFIDDRDRFLKPFKDNNMGTILIQHKTHLPESPNADYKMNWGEIFNFLMKRVVASVT